MTTIAGYSIMISLAIMSYIHHYDGWRVTRTFTNPNSNLLYQLNRIPKSTFSSVNDSRQETISFPNTINSLQGQTRLSNTSKHSSVTLRLNTESSTKRPDVRVDVIHDSYVDIISNQVWYVRVSTK